MTMARSKRKPPSPSASASPHSQELATKKHRENGGTSVFSDQLCDNTLLRILSYTDLRSLIHLTRCTSASLRRRFDPRDSSGHCGKIWRVVFGDLHMAPLDEADRTLGYFDAIGYRVSLYRTLVAHDRRARAAGNAAQRCYSLPLRHHHFRPLNDAWALEGDEEDVDGQMVQTPFGLLSGGSTAEFVYVDPLSLRVEIHESVLEGAICLDKSAQKSAAAAAPTLEDTISRPPTSSSPRQILIDHYYKSLRQCQCNRFVDEDWEDYFGKNSPFAGRCDGANGVPGNVIVCGLMVFAFDPTNEDLSPKSRKIGMFRVVKDTRHPDYVCTEFFLWGDQGCCGQSPSKFSPEGVCRLPLRWQAADICTSGSCIFASFDENDGSSLPEMFYPGAGNTSRAVFRFPLSSNLYDSASFYSTPDYFFLADHDVCSFESIANNLILVGTTQGTVELWDAGSDAPCRLCVYQNAVDTFLPTSGVSSSVASFYQVDGRSLRQGFLTQHGLKEEAIALWQTRSLEEDFEVGSADFRIMATIKYECIFPQVISHGGRLMVLAHDKFGSLYLDVYQIFGSMYALPDYGTASPPKGVSITNLHPCGEERIQFANRINIRHRVPVEYYEDYTSTGLAERVHIDMNDRFVTIVANDGLVGSDGARKSGPGIIVIDLDKHGSCHCQT